MSVLSLFKKPKPPADSWHPANAVYPSLFDLGGHAPVLIGKGGIYALWHLGVRPQWLRVGASENLLNSLQAAAAAPQIAAYRANGGLFAAWAFCEAARAPGIVAHLQIELEPVLQRIALPGDAVLDPGIIPMMFPLPPGTTAR